MHTPVQQQRQQEAGCPASCAGWAPDAYAARVAIAEARKAAALAQSRVIHRAFVATIPVSTSHGRHRPGTLWWYGCAPAGCAPSLASKRVTGSSLHRDTAPPP